MKVTDWEQNDAKKSDYIKNKPFGEYQETLNKVNYVEPYWDGSDICEVPLGENTEFKKGDMLTAVINTKGKVYSADFPVTISDQGVAYIHWEDTNPDGWNFYVGLEFFGQYMFVTHNCEVDEFDQDSTVEVYKSTIKQLDEKFIPDTIARKSDVEALIGTANTELESILSGGVD